LRLDMNGSQAAHQVEYDLNLTTARAGALLERWTTFGERLTGTVNFDITGSSPLDDGFLPLPAGFTAMGSASFVEGRFEDFGITDAVKQRFDLAPGKLTQFKEFGGPFEIRDGQFVVRNWNFGAGNITGVISGAAGLGGVLDLDIAAMLPVEAIRASGVVQSNPALGALLNQLSGDGDFIPVKLAVGGTMESPVLGIDANALATALREHAQSQGLGQLQDAGRNLLEQLVAPAQEEPEGEQAP
ncbi:MAG: AsmA-like C-terminal region-containing protein, partial [Gemmatimonadota bacterium]